ncbi:acyltransferase [Litchfieldella anticariensis FP35 = DSM 16096]|uniref:Acyltransferase n=1 Tax=Litchfieldella anticariensis (strain DSM 16096 / CECT 5854 / CIP 108499 / LMG 22089 / FP35) TaxID=1121939 RepID=S2L6R2_LITA3|nr:1-acyl-sn-glycerol-3-phosphate acyltransferase [Halomonas anticariensis]EPC03464.1 acyltransferase [Halomonas anticariensis FP35 = DSM 16096]
MTLDSTSAPKNTNSQASDPFADIRPYHDDEVAEVLARLADDAELLDALTQYKLPRLARFAPKLARAIVSFALRREMRGVDSVRAFQMRIADYMQRMIRTTTDAFEVEGLDKLDPAKAYLFIGNHRDIALDPAFVNYALYQAGRDTVRIAIGDNLLQKPYVSDLMRLNKSFIVPRSARGKRAMLAAYQALSSYIRHSITKDNHSVWLAQREGRAKDGIDRADPAIIKMLTMARRQADKDANFGDAIAELRMVPVSISYEYDPCDLQKARELYATHTEGRYQKVEFEDIRSIVAGITGAKGRIKLTFGEPLSNVFDSPDSVAEEIDRQVLGGYRLFPSHQLALEASGLAPDLLELDEVTDADRERFNARLDEVPTHLRDWWLAQYANPVLNRAGRL